MSHGSGKSYAPEFVAALKEAGFDFFAGVPCSLLKGLVSLLDADASARYISATREDSALGSSIVLSEVAMTWSIRSAISFCFIGTPRCSPVR